VEAAATPDWGPIDLIDGELLAENLLRHSIGVRREATASVWHLERGDLNPKA
jgi:hypothetical protein